MQTGDVRMNKGRITSLIFVSMAALLIVAGCGPRATGGQLASTADAQQIVIDLPALVIDIQEDGQAALAGVPIADTGRMLGADFGALAIDPATVQTLVAANIQHFQIDNTQEGLLILVNGEPIPSIAWDGESLIATGEMLDNFGMEIVLLDRVLPLVRNLGVGAIIRMPVAEGEEVIPFVVIDEETAAAAAAAQQEFLDAVGGPPTFQLVVNYDEEGNWSVSDLTAAEWSQVAPLPWDMLNLDPALVQGASASGIEEVGIATNASGIFISVNGRTLPHITWAEGRINHVINLAVQLGLLEGVGANAQDIVGIVQNLLPAVQASNVNVRVLFP
jgi:hypothetical protein